MLAPFVATNNRQAVELWDAAYALAKSVGGFKTYRQSPSLTIRPEYLPQLGVYLLRERLEPQGDENAGEPHFLNACTLGFSGIILQSDMEAQLRSLAQLMNNLYQALLTDPDFIVMFRGIMSIDTRLVFTRQGETPLAEYQMEMICRYETDWPPVVPDYFKQMVVNVQPIGFSQDAPVITVVYNIQWNGQGMPYP
jgi:hypothetical protein